MVSTGFKGLDKIITGLQLGDNVVWQIDAIDDYKDFVLPFVRKAIEEKRRLVYIRFANHKPLLKKQKNVTVYELNAHAGFESFSAELNTIIGREGRGVFYVFDCLSDLLSAWSNDLMIGNFFKITCPYLFELDTIAYFGILRNNHSFKTIARIRDTTQLLIDVYHYAGSCYIHPLKVWNRYSPTMFLPHAQKGEAFVPIASSADTAALFSDIFKKGTRSTDRKLDYWDRLFMSAETLAGARDVSPAQIDEMVDGLARIVIARDEKMLALAKKYLTLDDFLNIKARMIGTGFIGGKSVGMLIARNILLADKHLKAASFFEPHDSFYIGSDVFYTYIVENGWWKARMEQRTKEGYFEVARTLKGKLLAGVFPDEIKEQFQQMIEYFGQSPIIVRSSSLLEDGYGNAFAGKYESIFLVNQGTPGERYARFVEAVRRIYASTMNEDALAYRWQRGLAQHDEQMALLVQRVSGAYHDTCFFPDAAGVGVSYNTFVWKKEMDPRAGMLRLVVGLGTRSVNRVEGDYPRIVALDDPLLKTHADRDDAHRFSQHDIDLLNIKENRLETVPIRELIARKGGLRIDRVASKDDAASERLHQLGRDDEVWTITFDDLVSQGSFRQTMQKILQTLEAAYQYPVDIEFTINFTETNDFRVNLLQCRPLQTKGLGQRPAIPAHLPDEQTIFATTGNFLGGNITQTIDRIIYVDPRAYSELATQSDRYDIARAVGELNRLAGNTRLAGVMLLGPGRWGTTTPTLGVPVSFAEINHIAVLGEIAFTTANAAPELSFGTHFFQDLVETGIFYVALFPEKKGVYFNQTFFDTAPDRFPALLPGYKKYARVVRVFDLAKGEARIVADIITQRAICHLPLR